ncbi:MAG: glycogen debranching protein GlgX [Planctomycetota bacterium]
MQMRNTHPDLQLNHALPYGAIIHDRGVQFVVFSRSATEMRLLLYDDVAQREPSEVVYFDSRTDRWGDIWSVFVPGIGAGQLYHFQASGPFDPARGLRFDPNARLIDPFAKALAGNFQPATDGVIRPPKCVVVDDYFDWQGDRHLRHDLSESVIYELHVRGFTAHPSSLSRKPGTYLGVIDKIPYLKSLGVTAVELMPVHEFPTNNFDGTTDPRRNYWGYDPLAFFSPHRGYAADGRPGAQVQEFKEMVKALHSAGIEVILDVVFNHTCEGNERGPVLSFKGLENPVYYMLEHDKRYYRNYSGCGNTVNGNHPIVREMIFHCLRHWVHNYHIDGFRFDLASILSRDRNGNLVPNPPLVEAIGEDPLLADTKIIAEAWDAAGAYQVGSFGDNRWAEWNGHFRDDVRRFWRGDPAMRGRLATRLAGSADLYQAGGRAPCSSINFVTSHDGFTLNDLVSFNHKHNLANGEDNRDGDNNNFSFNHGVEGPTKNEAVETLRVKQLKNMLTTLLVSQGVPMLLAGDEFRRSQQGNNNAYCQDNEISWIDWTLVQKNEALLRFVRTLIHFRRNQPVFRRMDFLTGEMDHHSGLPDVGWYSPTGTAVNWSADESALVCLLSSRQQERRANASTRDVVLLFNGDQVEREFITPSICRTRSWSLFVDTDAESPADIFPDQNGPLLHASGRRTMAAKSVAIYLSR